MIKVSGCSVTQKNVYTICDIDVTAKVQQEHICEAAEVSFVKAGLRDDLQRNTKMKVHGLRHSGQKCKPLPYLTGIRSSD